MLAIADAEYLEAAGAAQRPLRQLVVADGLVRENYRRLVTAAVRRGEQQVADGGDIDAKTPGIFPGVGLGPACGVDGGCQYGWCRHESLPLNHPDERCVKKIHGERNR